MRVPRIYCASPLAPPKASLDDSAAQHLVKVLRLRPPAPVILFDGLGGEWDAELDELGPPVRCNLVRHHPVERESPLALVLIQGLPRADTMDLIIQKATELGASELVPVITQRSPKGFGPERAPKRLRHWSGIVRSACEQSHRTRLPRLAPISTLEAALTRWGETDTDAPNPSPSTLRLMLTPNRGTPLRQHLHAVAMGEFAPPQARTPLHAILAIGPEGGWNDDEQAAAAAAGFRLASLGPRILRAETAAIAALTLVQDTLGDLAADDHETRVARWDVR